MSTPPTVVLLRGLTREAGHWGPFTEALARRLPPGARVLTPDLPGNGVLWRERSPARVEAMAQQLREAVATQARAPVHVVALSLGGMVALEWARQAPQSLRSAVLVNSSAGGHARLWQRLLPSALPGLVAAALPWRDALARERSVLRATSSRPGEHAEVAQAWARIARQRPVAPANAARQLWAAARYSAPPQCPAVPLMLVCSAGDRLVSPDCSRLLAQAWAVPLAEHPSAGHDLPLDAPQWLAERTAAWVLRFQ